MGLRLIESTNMEKELNREVEQLSALLEKNWDVPTLNDVLKQSLGFSRKRKRFNWVALCRVLCRSAP